MSQGQAGSTGRRVIAIARACGSRSSTCSCGRRTPSSFRSSAAFPPPRMHGRHILSTAIPTGWRNASGANCAQVPVLPTRSLVWGAENPKDNPDLSR